MNDIIFVHRCSNVKPINETHSNVKPSFPNNKARSNVKPTISNQTMKTTTFQTQI